MKASEKDRKNESDWEEEKPQDRKERRAHLKGEAWHSLHVGAGWHTCSQLHNYSIFSSQSMSLVTDGQWYSWDDDGMPVRAQWIHIWALEQ